MTQMNVEKEEKKDMWGVYGGAGAKTSFNVQPATDFP
jgi:hypothetical protein